MNNSSYSNSLFNSSPNEYSNNSFNNDNLDIFSLNNNSPLNLSGIFTPITPFEPIEDPPIQKQIFTTNPPSKLKIKRRDYYIKKIKVFSLSKWLIEEINLRLKNSYGMKNKMQKPSQSLITETKIVKNRLWLEYTVENFLTNDLSKHYKIKRNLHWEKKKKKANERIFASIHQKNEDLYKKDKIFQRTMKQVIEDYAKSEQFAIDKMKFKEIEERKEYEEYLKGSDKMPGIIEYFMRTQGNKEKDC